MRVINTLESAALADEGDEAEMTKTCMQSYMNMALCHMKLGNYGKSLSAARKVLEWREDHSKALYVCGKVLRHMGEFSRARWVGLRRVRELLASLPDVASRAGSFVVGLVSWGFSLHESIGKEEIWEKFEKKKIFEKNLRKKRNLPQAGRVTLAETWIVPKKSRYRCWRNNADRGDCDVSNAPQDRTAQLECTNSNIRTAENLSQIVMTLHCAQTTGWTYIRISVNSLCKPRFLKKIYYKNLRFRCRQWKWVAVNFATPL